MRFVAKTLGALVFCASSVVLAQTGSHGSAHHAADMVDGEVRMLDSNARNVTLRHAEIKNMQMPAMTMVFNVKEAKLLDNVKKGDKVSSNSKPWAECLP